jgi:hypothetical protein
MVSPAGCRASPHTRQASSGRDCTRCTQRYAGRCPKMPARCGRASSEPGTSDRQDVQSPRAERRTIAVEVGTSCFFRTGLRATLSITAHVLRAGRQCYSMPSRLSARCSILLNLRNLLSFFSSNLLSKKKDRAAFAGGPSQGGNPRGRAATAGDGIAIAYLVLQIPKAPRIDEAQFSAHVSRLCVATVRIAADHVGGTWTACSRRNAPATLIASATKRPRVSASASPTRAVILRSNTIDVPLATSAQFKVRARNGFTFRSPCFRPRIAQFAAMRWPASRYLNP